MSMSSPPPLRPNEGNSTLATVALILIGVILLLPGLCSLGFMIGFGNGLRDVLDPTVMSIAIPTFAIAAGGIVLIRHAVRSRRR
jgi:hypothetical protein